MNKGSFKQQRFSLRKLKVGLASVAVLFSFAQLGQASADETVAPAASEATKPSEASKSPIESAADEIAATKKQPVVKEAEAKAGDVIDLSTKVSPVDVKESQVGNQKVHVETATAEVSKTEVVASKDETIPAPATTTTEDTVTGKDEKGNTFTQYERVDKTTIVEMTTTPATVQKTGTADIVFVIDRSLSMSYSIHVVRKNVNEFSKNLSKEGVSARFVLATFSDEVYGRERGRTDEGTILTDFGGSYFTSDPAKLEKALADVKLAIGGDAPETSIPALNQIISTYDWSKAANSRKFVVLLTDADMKEDPSIPTVAETIANLKAAGIERYVSTPLYGEKYYKDFVSEGRWMNMSNDLAGTLTNEATKWIAETVKEGRSYKITKDSYKFYQERRTTIPVVEKETPQPKPTPQPQPQPIPQPKPTAHVPVPMITATKPVAAPAVIKQDPAKLPETGSEASSTGLVGLALLMSGLGLTVANKNSKEQ